MGLNRIKARAVLVPALLCSLLLAGCSAATTDAVAPETSNASGSAGTSTGSTPPQGAAGTALPGRVGSGDYYETTTAFRGNLDFNVTDMHGFNRTVTAIKGWKAGAKDGFRLDFYGPEAYNDPFTGTRYGDEFADRTGLNVTYHGNGSTTVGYQSPDTVFTKADLTYVTGYVCGDLRVGNRTEKDFCVARLSGKSYWWHYFGGKNFKYWDQAYPAATAQTGVGFCQVDNLGACFGSDTTSADSPTRVWSAACTGDLTTSMSEGCLVPETQARIIKTLTKTSLQDGVCAGSGFAGRDCAVINILPMRQKVTTKPDGSYTVSTDRDWYSGQARVCGNPRFAPASSHGELVQFWPGVDDRNMAVLLRSVSPTKDSRISGTITQKIAPDGNCTGSRTYDSHYTVNWDPKSNQVSESNKVPQQRCDVDRPQGASPGLVGCSFAESYTKFKDQVETAEVDSSASNSWAQVAAQSFILALSHWAVIDAFDGDPIGGWLQAMATAFSNLILSSSDPYAYLFTTVFVGPVS